MPTPTGRTSILTLNAGSSSLKFSLFDSADPIRRRLSGRVERVGLPGTKLSATDHDGGPGQAGPVEARDQEAAAGVVADWIEGRVGLGAVAAVGHRIVHGGGRHVLPERITPEVVADLRRLGPLDPDHLPGELAIIEAFGSRLPEVPQVACYDTAFHHDLPRVARILPIPRRYEAAGVRRYGFHGLSYAYLMEELARLDGPEAAGGRVILAHLGAGASLAAVLGGRCLDTTMAFTPTAGLVMATRSGDLDPGLVRFLIRSEGLSVEEFDDLVNHQSGLLGISETGSDFRDLLALRETDTRAAEAIDVFCRRAKGGIGAFAAGLGGLDTLVFAGGIGENSPEARAMICDGLGFLGIDLDPARNAAGAATISADGGRVRVRVIRTDEEAMIARGVASVVAVDTR